MKETLKQKPTTVEEKQPVMIKLATDMTEAERQKLKEELEARLSLPFLLKQDNGGRPQGNGAKHSAYKEYDPLDPS